jgi:lipoyl(octanoyl) transferase
MPCDQAQDERFIFTMKDNTKMTAASKHIEHTNSPVEWRISDDLVDYPHAIEYMEDRVQKIREDTRPQTVWLLEHPPLYTSGTSADPADLVAPDRFPVFDTGRGGQYTYHGPGQRIAYVMLDLKNRGSDVRRYVHDLEEWLITTLAYFNVVGERREGRVGIWVRRGAPGTPGAREDKIAAIGVRVRKWVTYHGISLNIDPDLEHFGGIVPCGISEHGVTSLWDLGITASPAEVDLALRSSFETVFQVSTTA